MSEIIETIKNITKDGDMYTYEQVFTRVVRTSIESLNEEKITLEAKIANVNHILTEIEKLKVP